MKKALFETTVEDYVLGANLLSVNKNKLAPDYSAIHRHFNEFNISPKQRNKPNIKASQF